ncbi:MAG TPA: hypothetical protein VG917_02440 [Patescibacteria group bacterium]|nr:hypothetical protein [Patescibacteria group bacterium]
MARRTLSTTNILKSKISSIIISIFLSVVLIPLYTLHLLEPLYEAISPNLSINNESFIGFFVLQFPLVSLLIYSLLRKSTNKKTDKLWIYIAYTMAGIILLIDFWPIIWSSIDSFLLNNLNV